MPPLITSSANPAVKAARKLGRRHGRARAGDMFLVEGPQAVREATPFLRRLFVTPDEEQGRVDLVDDARAAGADVVVATPEVLADISTTVTPQGVVGVAVLPEPPLGDSVADAGLVVVLHQVRDPGNAGTAIRTADAAGADAVVLTRGSVDPRSPKVVRSSTGSVFHLPIVDGVPVSEALDVCRAQGLRVVASAADAARAYSDADLSARVALVFGNEAHGLPAHVVEACDDVVRIPLATTPRHGFSGNAESLNLAATVAVLSYEAVRQRTLNTQDQAGTR